MPTYPELGGKIAVISGAGGNLGLAVVRRLHTENIKLALIDRNEDRLRQTLRGAGIDDSGVLIGPVDLTKKAEIDPFVDSVAAKFGRIDILIHTAGGYKPGAPVHEMDESVWDFLIDLNLKIAFLLGAAVARCMIAKGNKGRIINISGRAALGGGATISAYSAAKAGLLRLTESMSGELLDKGITVNAIMPSVIDTPQNRQSDPNADFSKWVSPESLADVIAFLASDAARDISGAAIPVYGRA
jgi:NAD(P)-dependent dehydrogenase (short-subunit alcohol dehydrogenase family)